MIDPSIALGIKQPEYQSPINSLAQALQVQGLQRQNQLGNLDIQERQASAQEREALRNYLAAAPNLDTPEAQAGLYKVAPTQAAGILKGRLDLQKTQGEIGKTAADTVKSQQEAEALKLKQRHDAITFNLQALGAVTNPQQAQQWITGGVKSGLISMQEASQSLQEMQQAAQTPEGFSAWRQGQQQAGMTVAQQSEQQLKQRMFGYQQTHDAATLAETAREHNLTAQVAREGHATTLQAAGMQPGGGLDDNSERTAQAIASGQLPAPTGMALLNPKNQRILGRVMEINPQYDSTTVSAKKKAASDFTTGSLGNSMRSFAVAGQHLDQLNTLVDALDNGNMQIVNKISQAYSTQTGNPAPTNFDAAKDVVSKEVVKAIVAGGGGVAERSELKDLMDKAKSPAQLKGVIQQYRNLMGAQHDALLQQRRAAGLPDSTLPAYTDANGSPTPATPKVVKFGDLK